MRWLVAALDVLLGMLVLGMAGLLLWLASLPWDAPF